MYCSPLSSLRLMRQQSLSRCFIKDPLFLQSFLFESGVVRSAQHTLGLLLCAVITPGGACIM
jgi:hypothetical protein